MELTLNQTLASLGYETRPSVHYSKMIMKDGEVVFCGDSTEVWEWLGQR
jgi:hypothetical protein